MNVDEFRSNIEHTHTVSEVEYKVDSDSVTISFNMSVDVFGRNFERRRGGSHGPPGVGFKLTSDGDYEMGNKKVCNIANAIRMDEAVNLRTLYRLRTIIFQKFNTKISTLEKDLKELVDRITDVEEKINRYGDDIAALTSIKTRFSKKLDPLDVRGNASEKNDTS